MNLEKALGGVEMSLILTFLICEHEISFRFSWIFFTFFHQYLSIFTSLLKFIPKTVFVFDEFLNQVSLFIYFFSEVMVVCRNTTNFSVDLISCKFADYFFIRVNSNFGLLIMTILLFFFFSNLVAFYFFVLSNCSS